MHFEIFDNIRKAFQGSHVFLDVLIASYAAVGFKVRVQGLHVKMLHVGMHNKYQKIPPTISLTYAPFLFCLKVAAITRAGPGTVCSGIYNFLNG